ncbi:MAG: hypothetical protein IPI02_18665 [Sterolibacteriaceae bacterium]|nr:hypothetical protein [Sterolibacteriaceae bacterium]
MTIAPFPVSRQGPGRMAWGASPTMFLEPAEVEKELIWRLKTALSQPPGMPNERQKED